MAPRRTSGAAAVATITAPVRCAAYCRVSTDAQADKEFNSIEAQLQACEAYIGLHREEGWTIAPERYHDAGFSGSNTKRPALQRLIADVEAGKIDVLVVYKYDRLSRSMLDFLQLLDFLKRHGVSFVSVSQRFDTSTPVGEMTLNILLSFAQFERQIIAERTRDKMRAARRRGRWTGGFVPLGYDLEDGHLVANKDEAAAVREIFELYVATPSLVKAADELNRRGCHRKSWTTQGGKRREGRPWNRTTLRQLLTDVVYIGRQKLGDEVFPGEHEGIVPKRLFDQVQRLMKENRSTGGARARNRHGFLLRGRLHCSCCGAPMVPNPARNGSRLYRYYRCTGSGPCPRRSLPADRVEQFVVDEIRRIGADPALQDETFRRAVAQVKAHRRGLRAEAKRLERDRGPAQAAVERLVDAVARTSGPAATAVTAELEKAHERVATIDRRLAEIEAERETLRAQGVDRDQLARALAEFDPIWQVLLTPERERVLQLLIDRIDYDGGTGRLEITWRLAGFGQLAAEVGS